MAKSATQQLIDIKAELNLIIRDIQLTAEQVNASSNGIGTDKCVARMLDVANNYKVVAKKLNQIRVPDPSGLPGGGFR